MGLRHRSIRVRVLLLVLVPVVSLIGVYAYAAAATASAAVSLARAKAVHNLVGSPVSALQAQVDTERGLGLMYLARPTGAELESFIAQGTVTNRSIHAFRVLLRSGAYIRDASPQAKAVIKAFNAALGTLPELRMEVIGGTIDRPQVLTGYSAVVTAGYRVAEEAIEQFGSIPIVDQSVNIISLDEAQQLAIEESDLFASDLAARAFPAADRTEFAQLVAVRRYLVTDTLPQLEPAYRRLYAADVSPLTSGALTRLENAITAVPDRRRLPPVSASNWQHETDAYVGQLGQAVGAGTSLIAQRAQAQANSAFLRLGLAGGLGLAAIIASLLLSLSIGRGLVRQLRALRESALDLASDRLPRVMARLRDGEDVDVAAEAPVIEAGADEIGQVQQAFNVAARTALQAAADEARLRRGISDVFRNLARRSQVLLHRQLRLLDGMERRASEPGELEDLFRIDHLTTRMRRHAEGLIILSGDSPGRSWRHPVPLMDVLRASVSEVEDYARIRVDCRSEAALTGPAVADVIHLIAELAENATVFSPPSTPVRISGSPVARGFAVEVEDRGLGITPERLDEINRDLASPPAFDLSGTDRLGLFIAGRLARRHDITISLRPSPYGGTTAIVLIPDSLVVTGILYEAAVASTGAAERSLSPGGPQALASGPADGTAQ
jgi:signal transduction histidine kinase